MLLGGKGCQQCGCVPCNDCTTTCTNPHTGTAFETVYHYYNLGVEEGNVSDGYLTAGGDVDTSDPYDGMDGTGPWYQDITGSFTFSATQTRFPCVVRISFWRNSFPLGPTTVPPPSSTLTGNTIKVNCTSGAVRVGDTVVNAGELYDTGFQVPSVTGAGDQSGADPRGWLGTISVAPVCDAAAFTVTARIDWNTKKRQHILYGTVRECYEIGTPCATACSGNPPPSTIYLTISNFGGTSPDSPFVVNGTYVLDRVPGFCDFYEAKWIDDCVGFTGSQPQLIRVSKNGSAGTGISMLHKTPINGGLCVNLEMFATKTFDICGTGVINSGTGSSYYEGVYNGTFDWEVSA